MDPAAGRPAAGKPCDGTWEGKEKPLGGVNTVSNWASFAAFFFALADAFAAGGFAEAPAVGDESDAERGLGLGATAGLSPDSI